MAELKTAQGLVIGAIPDGLLSPKVEAKEEEEKPVKRARKAKEEN